MTNSTIDSFVQNALLTSFVLLFVILALPVASFAQGSYTHVVSLNARAPPQFLPAVGVSVLVRHSILGDRIGVIDSNGGFEMQFPCPTTVEDKSFYILRPDGTLSNLYVNYHYVPGISTPYCHPDGQPTGTATTHLVLNPSEFKYVSPYQDLQNSGPTCPKQSVGEPVNVTNGNMWVQETDYTLSGVGEFIDLTRTYSSDSRVRGIFGEGWTSVYDERIVKAPDDKIQLRLGAGQGILFANSGNNVFLPATPGFYGQIIKAPNSSYTLTFHDGRVHAFNPSGSLSSLTDRFGNTTTLSYNGNYDLTYITEMV
jgi:Domain of unknown function (DUF6531)